MDSLHTHAPGRDAGEIRVGPWLGSVAAAPRLDALFRTRATSRHVAPESLVCLDGEPASHLYRVASGTVRCCTLSAEGRRHIFQFATPGDVLGAALSARWWFTAEAVDEVIVSALPRGVVETALSGDGALSSELRELTAAEIARRERELMRLAYLPAPERLLSFLEDFAAALGTGRDGHVRLPMTRQDIGDHLGLSLETVSRGFGDLKRRGRIEMKGTGRYRIPAPGRRGVAA